MNKKGTEESKKEKGFWEWLVYYGTLALIFLVATLYFSGRFGGAVTTKQFFFLGGVNLVSIPWIWLIIRDARYRIWGKSLITYIPTLAFLLSYAISTLVGVDVMTSIFSVPARGLGLIFMIHLGLLLVIVSTLAQVWKREYLFSMMRTMTAASVVVAVSTYFTNEAIDIGSEWLNATAGGGLQGNSSLAGTLLVFGIFLGIVLFLNETKTYKKWLSGLGVVVMLLSPMFLNIKGMFVTKTVWTELAQHPMEIIGQARAVTIAVFLGLILSGLLYGAYKTTKKWVRLGIGMILGVAAIAFVYIAIQIAHDGSKIQNLFNSTVGTNRILFWKEAAQGIHDRPWLGWGPENFRIVHNKYFNPALIGKDHGSEVWTDKPHNNLIEIVVTQGWIGLVSYAVLFGALIAMIIILIKREDVALKEGVLLLGMFFAYLLQNQVVFDSITSTLFVWVLIGIFAGFINSNRENTEPVNNKYRNQNGGGLIVVGIILTVVMTISWVFFSVIPAQKMIQAKKVFDAKLLERIKGYPDLFSGYGANYLYTDLGIITYTLAEAYSNGRQAVAQNPEHVNAAIQELSILQSVMDRETAFGANDYRLKLSQAMFDEVTLSFKKKYSQEEAELMIHRIETAIALSPTNPLGYLVYARTLVFSERIDEARTMIDKAIELNPSVKEAHDLKISFENYYGTYAQQQAALKAAQAAIPGYTHD